MTPEESLKNQKVIQSLLDDIKVKADKIKQLEEENEKLRLLLREINKISEG
jgi:cell shape-determining protein MreC